MSTTDDAPANAEAVCSAACDATDAGRHVQLTPLQGQTPWPKQPSLDELDNVQIEYNMGHSARGYCLIFNQMKFSPSTGQQARDGSDVDATALEASFRKLGFDVRPFLNLKAAEFIDVLGEYRDKDKVDHSDRDCFVLVILSHGYEGYFYTYDRQLRLDWVVSQFRPDACKSLAGKPKLFFIQACRGDKFDPGFESTDSAGDELDALGNVVGAASAAFGRVRIPLESDFYFFYSTPPGYFSWRNSQRGSWFVQQLTAVLDRHGDRLELQHLMLQVQRLVSSAYASDTGEKASSGMKQIPVVVSQLRKLLYFRSKSQV